MYKKVILMVFALASLLPAMLLTQFMIPVAAGQAIIKVPADYSTIQKAINAASSGGVILVAPDTYYENVVVNKTVSLIGENRGTTIIHGNGTGPIVTITASNVNISGFIIQNSPSDSGIYVFSSSNITIINNIMSNILTGIYLNSSSRNMIVDNSISPYVGEGIVLEYSDSNRITGNKIDPGLGLDQVGIILTYSTENAITNNSIQNNVYYGVRLYKGANDNTIVGNNIKNNGIGVDFFQSGSNTVYHNNFINNGVCNPFPEWENTWDNGYEGNYWSDYIGVDLDQDGIGDSPHIINGNNRDNHPLMGMFSDFEVTWQEETYHVTTICNSTVSAFEFDQVNEAIMFNVTGEEGIGFCRVCIPHHLMEPPYTVTVDGHSPQYVNYTLYDNGTHRWVYFTYEHSTHEVAIQSDTPPTISVLSPENKTYPVNGIPLTFTVSEPTSWIGYSLDGQMNMTITGNTTIPGLSEGSHSLKVYAKDTAGNTGASEIIYFTIKTQQAESSPTLIVAAIVIIALVGAAPLVYFAKVKKTIKKAK